MSAVLDAVTRSRIRAVLAGIALGVVVLALSIPLTAFAMGGSATPVRLVAADSVGDARFADVLFTSPLDVPAGFGDAPVGGTASGNLVAAHGGVRGAGRCSAAVLAGYFERRDNTLKAEAWAEALDLDPDAIGPHLAMLTPVILLRDVWAVAHDFRGGAAEPYDAVLQAGTDVLVDLRGVPRVRCADASPLLPAQPVSSADPVGTPWPGFDLTAVTTISAGAPGEVFVLADPTSDDRFERPVGGDGTSDRDHVGSAGGTPTGGADETDRSRTTIGRPPSTETSAAPVPSVVTVPDVAGLDEDEALEVLRDAAFDPEVTERVDVTSTTPAGVALGTEPGAGAELPDGTTVLLVISSGPLEDLTAPATGARRRPGPTPTVTRPSVTTPPATAPSTTPTTAAPTTTTTTGPTTTTTAPTTTTTAPTTTTTTPPAAGLVTVPGVVGQPPAAAGSALTAAGLGVNQVSVPGGTGSAQVTDQSPNAGQKVPAGTTVVLVVRGGA